MMGFNYADAIINNTANTFMANLPSLGEEEKGTGFQAFNNFFLNAFKKAQQFFTDADRDELKKDMESKTPPSDSNIEEVENELRKNKLPPSA